MDYSLYVFDCRGVNLPPLMFDGRESGKPYVTLEGESPSPISLLARYKTTLDSDRLLFGLFNWMCVDNSGES